MRQIPCDACGTLVPMAEAYAVRTQRRCRPCAAAAMKDPAAPVSAEEVHPLADPTVCARCRADGGESDLPLVEGLPTCGACRGLVDAQARQAEDLRFPRWVKLASVGVLLLTAFSYAHSVRFVRAHLGLRRAEKAFDAHRLDEAAERMTRAAAQVPEVQEYQFVAALYRGIANLAADRPEAALPDFRRAEALAPEPGHIHELVVESQRAIAFDHQDYAAFLRLSEENLKAAGETYDTLIGMSSALACRYAQGGAAADRKQALEYLEKARKDPKADPQDAAEWAMRIQHRLETREIMDRARFRQRYPKGWTSQEAHA